MRALVTGADGFLGANLCAGLLARGHDVVGAALRRKGHTSLEALGVNIRVEYGDVLDADYLRRVIGAHEIEWVFHLAAVSIVRVAARDPRRAIETNVMGTLNLLDACRYGPVEAVVVASSDKAYGDYGGEAYHEDMPLRPAGAYELSKALEDTLARGWAAFTDARITATRCANLYGPGDMQWSRLVPNSCRRIANGQPPEVHPGAWEYQREWLYVEDAVTAYALLAEKGASGEAYNVGSGERATAGAVACRLAERGRVNTPVSSDCQIAEIPAQALDCAKVRALGWRPNTMLWAGLDATMRWYHDYLRG
jgi:CDP-glucose 4,6-dehydratase